MARLLFASLVLVVGCGGPPPPAPPPAELEVAGAASLAGSWVADGELDWYYRLDLDAEGGLSLAVDRGKLGACEQRGLLQPTADPRAYTLVYEKNTCQPELGGGPFTLRVESFTGPSLRLAIEGPGLEQRRTYQRAPASSAQ